MKMFIKTILFSNFLLICSQSLFARCLFSETLSEEFRNTKIVIVGTAISTDSYFTLIKVSEVYKGKQSLDTIVMYSKGEDAFRFKPGNAYIIFANKPSESIKEKMYPNKRIYESVCTRTQKYSPAFSAKIKNVIHKK
jgi:hypothetical protein